MYWSDPIYKLIEKPANQRDKMEREIRRLYYVREFTPSGLVGAKVDDWITMSVRGFEIQCPDGTLYARITEQKEVFVMQVSDTDTEALALIARIRSVPPGRRYSYAVTTILNGLARRAQ